MGKQINIIATLKQRLKKHDSPYAAVFEALENVSASRPDADLVKNVMTHYNEKEPSKEEIDNQWTEEPVTFGGASHPDGEEKPITFIRHSGEVSNG